MQCLHPRNAFRIQTLPGPGKKIRLIFSALVGVALGTFFGARSDRDTIETVDFSRRVTIARPRVDDSSGRSLRVAVGTMISPQQTFTYYHQLLNYIGRDMDRPITMIQQFGNPPMVASRHLDPAVQDHIQTVLLQMHQHSDGHQILSELMIDRFALPRGEEWYLPVIEMKNAL